MTLEDLGNVGEFIGAVGVVLSLIYLAVQVNQNTRNLGQNTESVRTSTLFSGRAAVGELNMTLVRSPELISIFRRGITDPSSFEFPEDRSRFDLLITQYFANAETFFHIRNSLPEDLWAASVGTLDNTLRAPGVTQWWRESGVSFSRSFVDFVNERLDGLSQ